MHFSQGYIDFFYQLEKNNNKKWFTGGELKTMIDATSQCNLIRNVRWLIKDGLVSKKRAGKQVYYRWNK